MNGIQIPAAQIRTVMLGCRGRCAMCFTLNRVTERREGTTVRLDPSLTDSGEESLVYLCHDCANIFGGENPPWTKPQIGTAKLVLSHFVTELLPIELIAQIGAGAEPTGTNKCLSPDTYRLMWPLYRTYETFLIEAFRRKAHRSELQKRYLHATVAVGILCGEELKNYLAEVYRRDIDLHRLSLQIEHSSWSTLESNPKLIDDEEAQTRWFEEQLKGGPAMFFERSHIAS